MSVLAHLLTALVVTLVVGTVSGGGWNFLVGAVLALSLWVMVFAGSYATSGGRTTASQYAGAALFALVLGYVMFRVGGAATWWSVGFILAGAIVPAGVSAHRQQSRSADGA